ncbi:MAG: SRPBCC family protein [Acidimicrobiales bacterium]|nr:SRPBCC family protein [Acidimicrobiales bacterium]
MLVDLPVFLTSPVYRRWHMNWGATSSEVRAGMPGDDQLPGAQFRATRAITIAAPPTLVWPWLVQIGCTRAGWYSHDLLDNRGRPSATTIEAAWQDLHVGHWVPMVPKPPPTERTAFRVDSFEVERWLLWTKPDSTWSWQLTSSSDGGTRLVNRIRALYDRRAPLSASLSVVLLEFGDFAMNRRMMRGIKARAESLVHPAVASQPLIEG